jgi:hypothetical protein
MTILRLSAELCAGLMPPPSAPGPHPRFAACARPWQDAKKSLSQTMSRLLQMAHQFWDPLSGAAEDGLEGCSCRPTHRAAARLLRAIVLWQVRRLERRLANLEVDKRGLGEV